MRKMILYISVVFLLYCQKSKTQVIIESQPTKIEFNNPYKFNSYIEEKVSDKNKPWNSQSAFLDYALKGEFLKAQEIDDIAQQKQPSIPFNTKQIDSLNAVYAIVDAKEYIVEQAKLNQITIINEAHHNPRHRVFTRSLLKELYEAGYTFLGLEALYNGPKGGTQLANGAKILDEYDSELNSRKYPIRSSGSYTQEPQFGNLIRDALSIGFTIFAYEKSGVGSGHPREVGQAKNIQAVIRENPDAKILIHCGLAHAYEGYYKAWGKAIAGHLADLTGINPLTINQVKYSEYSKSEYNEPLSKAYNLKKSFVLVNNDGNAMRFEEGEAFTDVAVIHPPTQYSNSRPSWLYQNGVKSVELDLSLLNIDLPVMILVFKDGEDINNAIPVDIVEVSDNVTIANLALEIGEYTVVAVNNKSEARKFEISVK